MVSTERFRESRRMMAVALATLVAFGCGDSGIEQEALYETKGKVMLANDSPLTSGSVEFVPVKGTLLTPSGTVGSDGTFSLSTSGMGDGAPAGDYRVRIVPDPEKSYSSSAKGKSVDPKKIPYNTRYLDEDRSGLTATVKAEPNQLEPFHLKK